eukprot:5384234-Lingulodinium_polyedra.AAC.1
MQDAPTKAWHHRHGTKACAIHQADCTTAMNYVQPRKRCKTAACSRKICELSARAHHHTVNPQRAQVRAGHQCASRSIEG